MSRAPARLLLAASVLALAGAAPPREPLRPDRHGDPLPPGAVARLGSVRLRHLGLSLADQLALSPAGQSLASLEWRVRVWELRTGKLDWQAERSALFDWRVRFTPES